MDSIVFELFKGTLPECVATYVAEKQAKNKSDAAVLVDEYELTHKAHMRSSYIHKEDFSSNRNVTVMRIRLLEWFAQVLDLTQIRVAVTGNTKWSCPVLKAKSNERFSCVKSDPSWRPS